MSFFQKIKKNIFSIAILCFFIFAMAFLCVVIFNSLRDFIIEFTETYVLNRKLNQSFWNFRLLNYGKLGFAISLLCIILLSISFLPKVKILSNEVKICILIAVIVIGYQVLPFLLFGQDSVITVHDNLDADISFFKLIKQNNYLFKLNEPLPMLNNLSSLYLGGTQGNTYTFESFLYCIFPDFVAYTIFFTVSILVGFFSMYYFLKLLFKEYTIIKVLIALMFAILPAYHTFKMASAALPLVCLLFYYLYMKRDRRLIILLFIYPVISSFAATGIFVCGFWLLAIIILSVKNKKIDSLLVLGFFALCLGYVIVNFKLFYMRFVIREPLNRDFFAIDPKSFISSFYTYFVKGQYHASTLQDVIILPIVLLVGVIGFIQNWVKTKSLKTLSSEIKILDITILVIILFSLIATLYDTQVLKNIISIICPPLSGFNFSRIFILNKVLWYVAFCATLICLVKKNEVIFASCLMFLQLVLISTSTIFYADSFNSWKRNLKNNKEDYITYKEFFDTKLFDLIKRDINYSGEQVVAFGYHPSVLMYNGFNTIDGYTSVYPYKDMLSFRKLIEPELKINDEDRKYFDSWGGRRYLYNAEIDQNATRCKVTKPIKLNIDFDYFANELKGKYILSRIELSNENLYLINKYTTENSIYTIWVYESR